MKDFHLEKFPVTSENGVEYLVIITRDKQYPMKVEVDLFEKKGKRNIFGKEKNRSLNVDAMGYGSLYNEKEWDYDYIAMAINEVKKYEQRIMNQIITNAKKAVNELKFQEWDGNAE